MANYGLLMTTGSDCGTITYAAGGGSPNAVTTGSIACSDNTKAFLSFDLAAMLPDTDDVVTGRLYLTRNGSPSDINAFDASAYLTPWSPTPLLLTDGFNAPQAFLGTVVNANNSAMPFVFSSPLMAANISKTGRTDIRVAKTSAAVGGGVTFNPPGFPYNSAPMMRVRTAPAHYLRGAGGSHCQLSNGGHVYMQTTSAASTLRYIAPGATTSSVALTTTTLFGFEAGYEAWSIARDASDHLYVIGPAPSTSGNGFIVRRFAKGAGFTWTDVPAQARFTALPTTQRLTASSLQWINESGGRLRGQVRYTPSGGGTILAIASTATPLGTVSITASTVASDTGTLLDTTKSSPTSLIVQHLAPTLIHPQDQGTLNINGATASNAHTDNANTKARIFAISDTETVAIYPYATVAFSGVTQQETTTGVGWRAAYTGPSATVPVIRALTTATNLNVNDAITFKWDAAYDPVTKIVWLYYIDSATPTSIRRTPYYVPNRDWLDESSPVATAPAGVVSLSTPRGPVTTQTVLLHSSTASGEGITYDTLSAPAVAELNAPLAPTVSVNPVGSTIVLTITNPTDGTHPAAAYNNVYRRPAGAIEWTKVRSELTRDATWTDHGVAAGINYEYQIEAVAF